MEDTGLRCLKCRYNLTGLTGDRCPECGQVIDWQRLGVGTPDGALSDPPFSIDFARRLSLGQIDTHWDGTPADTSPELEAILDEHWAEQLANAKTEDRHLYNGAMIRLVKWQSNHDGVMLHLGPTDYRHFLGTNFLPANNSDSCGSGAFANPLGTSAIAITQDGYLIFGRRSKNVACLAGYYHPVGGTLEPSDCDADRRVDVFEAMAREIREELQIGPEDITGLVCLGMVRDLDVWQPEMIFEASLGLTRTDIESAFDAGADEQEHDALVYCYDEPDSVLPFIEEHQPFAPVAVAGLLLHGRYDWGVDWYEAACFQLFGDLPSQTPSGLTPQ